MVQHGMLTVNIERRPISLSDLRQIGVLTEKPVVTIMEAMHQGENEFRSSRSSRRRSQNPGKACIAGASLSSMSSNQYQVSRSPLAAPVTPSKIKNFFLFRRLVLPLGFRLLN